MEDKTILVQIAMPPTLRAQLKRRAVKNRRSLRGEALAIIEEALSDGRRVPAEKEAIHA
jgi:plasmid stability protein